MHTFFTWEDPGGGGRVEKKERHESVFPLLGGRDTQRMLGFFQTDVCGIKWTVFREEESQLSVPPQPQPQQPQDAASPAASAATAATAATAAPASSRPPCSEDQVLSSYSKCLEAELLAVWRRVPKRALVTYTYDMSGMPNQVREESVAKPCRVDTNQTVTVTLLVRCRPLRSRTTPRTS